MVASGNLATCDATVLRHQNTASADLLNQQFRREAPVVETKRRIFASYQRGGHGDY